MPHVERALEAVREDGRAVGSEQRAVQTERVPAHRPHAHLRAIVKGSTRGLGTEHASATCLLGFVLFPQHTTISFSKIDFKIEHQPRVTHRKFGEVTTRISKVSRGSRRGRKGGRQASTWIHRYTGTRRIRE